MPRTLRGWIVLLAIASIALGLLANRVVRRVAPAESRARWAQMAGKADEAERIWWAELQRGNVTVPVTVAFLAQHRMAVAMALLGGKLPEDHPKIPTQKKPKADAPKALPEAEVEAFFARPGLPHEVTLVWRMQQGDGDDATLAEIQAAAARTPPVAWMNHVLAVRAAHHGKLLDAATYYEREALAFGRRDDLETAFVLREEAGDHEGVVARLNDPSLGPLAPPHLQMQHAIDRRDYARAMRWLLPFSFPKPHAGPFILAVVAAIGWGAFCLRLGQVRRDPKVRVPLYALAFALGCLSIAPTMFLIVWQESVLHLTPNGTLARDAVYYILGVGFREELSKLLLFLPLLPLMLRRGQLVEVVACGALVGLGFAAVENLGYFSHGDLGAALGRFMTANFLHMSMTAIIATAFYRMFKQPDGFHDFTVAFLMVVALHGIYDLFLGLPDMSYFAMTVFVFLARDFVVAMHDARLRAGNSKPLLPVFAVGTTLVCGATFVYASVVVGPAAATELMFLGLLGVAILTIVFVRQLRVL